MTKKAFVIGHPIAHSRSPLIHNHWLHQHNIDGAYQAVDVDPKDLPVFIKQLRQGAFVGGNVTIPHKLEVFTLCDSIADDAQTIGAVNTLVMRAEGLHGFNTDLAGFLGNLDQNAPGWAQNSGHAIVLGAGGGAARAVLIGLAQRGFDKIYILNRTLETAVKLAGELPGPFEAVALTEFNKLAVNAAIVVNTSAVGMHGSRFDGLDLTKLPATALVTDIVYTPLETPLLTDAKSAGLKTVDGLGMLLHQAVPGFEAWFGVSPTVSAELRDLVVKDLGLH